VRLWPSSTATSLKQIAGTEKIQGQAAAVGAPVRSGFGRAAPEQGVTGIAFLEQHFAHTQILGVARLEIRCSS